MQWRYMHEQPSVEASTGEMRRAFDSLMPATAYLLELTPCPD
jgi:hypothetical protein